MTQSGASQAQSERSPVVRVKSTVQKLDQSSQRVIVPERVLSLIMNNNQRRALEPATRKGNIRKCKKFLAFCEIYHKVPLPVSIDTLCKYAAYLSLTFTSPDSILNYLRGVVTLHKQCLVTPPDLQDYRVSSLLKGLAKNLQHSVRQAAPMTPEMLAEMYVYLNVGDPYGATVWAMFLVAFYCMLRKSNITPESDSGCNPAKILLREDIRILRNSLLVNIKWSKTKQAGGLPTVLPLLSIPGSVLCPFTAYCNMVALNPAPSSSPAFINPDGSVLLYSQYTDALKTLASRAGYNAALFSTHSFRRGGATFGFRASVDLERLKLQGSWASDAILDYVRLPEQERLKTFELMREEIINCGL